MSKFNEIVNVSITRAYAQTSARALNTLLILTNDGEGWENDNQRVMTFGSVADVESAGFSQHQVVTQVFDTDGYATGSSSGDRSPKILDLAKVVFAQNPGINRVKFGRIKTAQKRIEKITLSKEAVTGQFDIQFDSTTVSGLSVSLTNEEFVDAINDGLTGTTAPTTRTPVVIGVQRNPAVGGLTDLTLVFAQDSAERVISASSNATTPLMDTEMNTGTIDLAVSVLQLPVATGDEDDNFLSALKAVNDADSDWYGLFVDFLLGGKTMPATIPFGPNAGVMPMEVAIAAVLEYIEASDPAKLMGLEFAEGMTTAATTAYDASSTDLADVLKASKVEKTFAVYSEDVYGYVVCAIFARQFTQKPGSSTFAYKTLKVAKDTVLSGTAISNLESKNINYYLKVADTNLFLNGVVPSGEYIDIIFGIDYVKANVSLGVFSQFPQAEKIPMSQAGIQMLTSSLKQLVLDFGTTADNNGLIDANTVEVTAPAFSEISAADKQARKLTGVKFKGRILGAIQKIEIVGQLYL